MKKIDKYIIGKYLKTILFCILIFSLISGAIDISEKLDDIIEDNLSFGFFVKEYFIYFIMFINGQLMPLYALIAVIFFTSRMAYNSEIISILNAGVSFGRLLRPYIISAIIVCIVHLCLNHFIIPLGSEKRVAFSNKYLKSNNDKAKTKQVHMFINPNEKIYLDTYNKRDSSGNNFSLEILKDGKIESILSATSIKWKEPPSLWTLRNYNIHTFNGLNESIVSGMKMDTTINFTPEDFVNFGDSQQAYSSIELQRYINKQRARGAGGFERYQIELHRRTSDAITIIILTLIGVALASRKVRGGMGLHLALGAGIGSLFIVMMQFSATFVTNGGLDPLLGVWIPNIIFSIVAAFLVFNAQK